MRSRLTFALGAAVGGIATAQLAHLGEAATMTLKATTLAERGGALRILFLIIERNADRTTAS